MLWRMPADTRGQRIGTMATAQTFSAHPQPATNVSATNVFHRPKWAALTALTALTPGMGAPIRTATGVTVAEIAGIGRSADGSKQWMQASGDQRFSHHCFSRRRRSNRLQRWRWCREGPTSVTVLPPCFPGKNKGSAISGQPLDFIGGAKRDRTVDLYNAIVALSQLSYGPETSGTARDIIPAPLTGNRGTGNSA